MIRSSSQDSYFEATPTKIPPPHFHSSVIKERMLGALLDSGNYTSNEKWSLPSGSVHLTTEETNKQSLMD